MSTLNPNHRCPTEEEIINALKVEVLQAHRQTLSSNLIPDRHMDFLRSKYILSEEDCEEINHHPTRRKRASKFLDILGVKGAEAYDALCAALKVEGTQIFLLEMLNKDFEQRLQSYRVLMGQQQQQQPRLLPISAPTCQPPPPPSYSFSDTFCSGYGTQATSESNFFVQSLHPSNDCQEKSCKDEGRNVDVVSQSSSGSSFQIISSSISDNSIEWQLQQSSTESVDAQRDLPQSNPRLPVQSQSPETSSDKVIRERSGSASHGSEPELSLPGVCRLQPTENDETEDSLSSSFSFFKSLDVSLVECQKKCSIAVNDQQKALDKCLDNPCKKGEHSDDSPVPKPGGADQSALLLHLSLINATEKKTIINSDEPAQTLNSENGSDTKTTSLSSLEQLAGSCSAKLKEARTETESFEILNGVSTESRNSVHGEDGQDLHSSQC